ncbi:MAG: hypothetical protein J7639_11520 [Paenibacillaceae bacterium]|nr:hypothetical protein [Paenibacillaceae bacterium]
MKPDWFAGGWSLRWFAGGAWRECDASAGDAPAASASVTVGLRYAPYGGAEVVAVCAKLPPGEHDCDGLYAVDVSVASGGDGTIAGALLRMPLAPGLQCVWKPHLCPEPDMAIADRVFRSPAIVLEDERRLVALIPDLDALRPSGPLPHAMDYALPGHELVYGLCACEERGHVYYGLRPEPVAAERASFRFYLAEWNKPAGAARRDLRPVERFLWRQFARREMAERRTPPVPAALEPYMEHTYGWAFERWRDVAWQSFRLGGEEAGGVVFIVTARQKPGEGDEDCWREPHSLWNQAWFSSLRSAYGYRLWGVAKGRADWIARSELALTFALSAPQTNGLFPGYYVAGCEGWSDGRWVESPPRRPAGHDAFVHLLDSSWTCYWLLKWYRDLKRDSRILPYVRRYVDTLLTLQRDDGGFPAWVRPDSLEASPALPESPETAAHSMLLCLLHELEPDDRYLPACAAAGAFLQERIVAEGRWEDFETYWSCAKEWKGRQCGVRDARSGLYHQNTFGMYWCAEAFLALHGATGDPGYLDAGERVLAELSLYQQIWEPDFMAVPTLGGFGVMNADDEWNDARQSLFALTYRRYHLATGDESYRLRGLWAMKASFYMMYCPENPVVRALYERVHPHFDERDYGFHMENFNHHDGTARLGLGEFTIFDWGNGAACASLGEWLHGGDGAPPDGRNREQRGDAR